MTLQNKTIWVTGASSGIGRELALQLSVSNHVIASARGEDSLKQLCDDSGGRITSLALDVTDAGQMEAAGQRLRSHSAHLDMCIVVAGTCEYLDVHDLDIEKFKQVFDVNVTGAARTVKAALPMMTGVQDARLVGVSSMSTVLPFGKAQAYGSSKVALEYFFRTCEIDLAGSGIGVTLVRPGFVDTPLTQRNTFSMPFLMTAQAAAQRIVKGLNGRRRMISFPRRLKWLLAVPGVFPSLWCRVIGPKLSGTA